MAEGGGHAPQRSRAHPGSGRELPPAASPSIAEDGALEAQRLRARSRSRRRRHPDRFILHMRRAENSNPTARTAHSLAARPGALTRSLSIEARRGIEPRHNSFAGCHQRQLGACHEYAGRDLHPHDPSGPLVPGTSASAFRHQRME